MYTLRIHSNTQYTYINLIGRYTTMYTEVAVCERIA